MVSEQANDIINAVKERKDFIIRTVFAVALVILIFSMFLNKYVLKPIGLELVGNYKEYKTGRKDWEQGYIQGLDLLGFKYENRTEPFQGASGATHPVMAEAVTQFQALAYKELLPASGPVRTQIVGAVDKIREEQSARVKDFMNYQLMVNMKEYEPEFDQMLFNLPLAGSTFKKVYFDSVVGRTVSKLSLIHISEPTRR